MGKVLAMYDIRGIQKYIFRTAKVKDAIGASAIVENIIEDALAFAVGQLDLSADLKWHDNNIVLPYVSNDKDVQVLYVGGGNAYITCKERELCIRLNQCMAKYVIEHTYSLQLAVAMVDMNPNSDYAEDYADLMAEMNDVKANMVISRPLGALPVMRQELKTGYPVSINGTADESTETCLKKEMDEKLRKEIASQVKRFDNYVTEKGVDSTLAVVHIDGNNMGLRIRELISDIHDYETAVNRMRRISYNINFSYKKVFDQMQDFFQKNAGNQEEYKDKENDNFILKILVAGDDITYVCNGKIAIATVEYYCKNIAKYAMIQPETESGEARERTIRDYGFSVCAGIAYIGSHFPFHVGYEVAEACCESAKKSAKKEENRDGNRIGNWLDFQICKNIQAKSLKDIRMKEYRSNHGESLIMRPYFISTEKDGNLAQKHAGQRYALKQLKSDIIYFKNEGNIPRSFAKALRNTYPQGKVRTELLYRFLESRNWKMPDGTGELYDRMNCAKWYDALELLDLYVDLDGMEAKA